MIEKIRSIQILGNSLLDYGLIIFALTAGFIGVWILKTIILVRLRKFAEKTETRLDDILVALIGKFIVPLLYFGVIYLGTTYFIANPGFDKGMRVIGITLLTVSFIRFIIFVIKSLIFDYWIHKKSERKKLEAHIRSILPALSTLIWGTGVVFLLDNFGFNISALVAGLGIGGVAVALAASAVLGDGFAYLAIMFDRPFELGDFIIVDDILGTIEHVGIKTTRIRSLFGEQIVISNKDLTDSRIKNYKRMERRRILFKLGVTYDTKPEIMKEIPTLIKNIIGKVNDTKFDRVHFSNYGDFNLEIEIVYYILSGDYNKYMDIQQQINLGILEEFNRRKIEFAFPTQTLHVNKIS